MRTTNTMNRSTKSNLGRFMTGFMQGMLVCSILPVGVILGWLMLNVNMGIVLYNELRKFLKA